MSENSMNSTWPFVELPLPKVIQFNNYVASGLSDATTKSQFYSNDPVIELILDHAAPRVVAVPASIQWSASENTVFTEALTHAAYGCSIEMISIKPEGEIAVVGEDQQPSDAPFLAILPPRPKSKTDRKDELQKQAGSRRLLCLFNVLVALEWRPNPAYLRQLQWSFRQASDFLYDVTDGYMALGQVVFGGIELMECADIQIFASSRLFPRSWVSGMYEEQKHSPIRVGRGLWKKNTRTLIPWDEPEGFRILVHEFAHYALGLKDRYLDRRVGVRATALGQPDAGSNRLVDWNLVFPEQKDAKLAAQGLDGSEQSLSEQPAQWSKLVVPSIALAVETIMSNLEGASELTLRRERGQTSEWDDLRSRFRRLDLPNKTTVDSGPSRLPLPLPEFGIVQVGAKRAEFPIIHPTASDTIFSEGSNVPAEQLVALPTLKYPTPDGLCVDPESCWAYVLRESIQSPTGLIAQGSLPAHADEHDHSYPILGVQAGDLIVLIGDGYAQPTAKLPPGTPATPIVLCAQYAGDNANLDWYDATPPSFPIVLGRRLRDRPTNHRSRQSVSMPMDQAQRSGRSPHWMGMYCCLPETEQKRELIT